MGVFLYIVKKKNKIKGDKKLIKYKKKKKKNKVYVYYLNNTYYFL